MRKLIFTLVVVLGCSYSFAGRIIDLQQEKIMCNKYRVSDNSKIGEIRNNCKVYDTDSDMDDGQQEQEFEFYATSPKCQVECKFINTKLTYCKIERYCNAG